MLDDAVDMCYGAALLLASIDAHVEGIYARGEKPPACWEDSRACVRGIIAACLGDAAAAAPVSAGTVAALSARLCDIARDCGVQRPEGFFS